MNYLNNIQKAISKSGLKKNYLADKLDMKYDTFRRKLNGETDFKVNEVLTLTKLLNIKIMEVFTDGKES
ncbi:MAG: BetR domain [Bacillales bacterium]|jgi:ribosome-binding protein aMBF1 (putative translation factor)|nr:BetR domain [Bacillales bacterium]